MTRRTLGTTGLSVHPLCLGGNVFGWSADEATSHQILDAYVEDGGNFIDTADAYSRWVPGHEGGESETIIGRWLAKRGAAANEDVVVATKVGSDMGLGHTSMDGAYVIGAVDASLQRLGVETIDLLYIHWDVPETPLTEPLEALDRLVRAGKVRAIAASNITGARLREALEISAREGWAAYGALQPEYNLVSRDAYEGELEDVAVEAGLGVAPYFSLASGFLTGKYRQGGAAVESVRAGGVQQQYFNARGWAVLDALLEVAARHDAKPAQVALAWLMARPSITSPIASATSVEQVRELVGAASLTLSAEDLAQLDGAGADA
ncbi:MAG TPA: aldo/keto reductase [Solirubrobacteraceae bacterium]|nr:aldo/keto reductase [Solirubrobacteraceae bacterium]